MTLQKEYSAQLFTTLTSAVTTLTERMKNPEEMKLGLSDS